MQGHFSYVPHYEKIIEMQFSRSFEEGRVVLLFIGGRKKFLLLRET